MRGCAVIATVVVVIIVAQFLTLPWFFKWYGWYLDYIIKY